MNFVHILEKEENKKSFNSVSISFLCSLLLLVSLSTSGQTLSVFSEKVKTKVLYGFKDDKGKVIVPATYDAVGDFYNDRAFVSLHGKFGFIDKSGKLIIPVKYACSYTAPEGEGDNWHIAIENFSHGIVKVQIAKNYTLDKNGMLDPEGNLPNNLSQGVIDKTGKVIIPIKYETININPESKPDNGLIYVTENNKMGIFSKTGKPILEPIYDVISSPSDNFVIAETNGDYYTLDLDTKEKVLIKYELYGGFGINDQNLIQVRSKSNGLIGFINRYGNEVIKVKYVKAQDFHEVLVCLYDGTNYGFLDASGNVVIDFVYDWAAGGFENGKVRVQRNGRSFFIDKKGKEVN